MKQSMPFFKPGFEGLRLYRTPRIQLAVPRLFFRILLAAFLVISSAGCLPVARTVYPTLTPTQTIPAPTATLTPVWFPPTATPTLLPSPSPLPPTPDQRPAFGSLIFTDTFQNPALWSARQAAQVSAAFGSRELSLTISGSKMSIYSLRSTPQLTNFYTELTANPVFCSGLDEYGLLLRAASANDYYRVGVSCDGRARVDRILDSGAASLLDWQYASGIPLGGPSIARLAAWAINDTFGLMVNDRLVLTFKDPKLTSGGLGVYARSAGSQQVTVNFMDLSVWEVLP